MTRLDELAKSLKCLEVADRNVFQRKARVLQALWRVEQGYPIGRLRDEGRQIGSLLDMPWAEQTEANFLDNDIRRVVREVLAVHGDGPDRRVIERRRLFGNLLSSQPMAFNLFSHLRLDLDLASAVFESLSGGRVGHVVSVDFEFSPGRGDPRYTGDRSAFDVYARYVTPAGGTGFAGIEVKYHESLADKPSRHHRRYDAVAEEMGCFDPEARDRLKDKPLQQIWRDHLLAGAHRMVDEFADGFFVFLSPRGNDACNRAVAAYRDCLASEKGFAHWDLETVVAVLRRHAEASWVDAFADRYLAFDRVDRALGV